MFMGSIEKKMLKKLIFISLITFISTSHAFDINKLTSEENIKIDIYASNLNSPRQIAEGDKGTIFVGERSGQIIALFDSDGNGEADEKRVIVKNLTYSTGVSYFAGDLYFSEIDSIWKLENIETWLAKNLTGLPKKTLVTNDLPEDQWHGWKWIRHDHKGFLYVNVGAPCNVCLSKDKRHASILKLEDNSWKYVAKGVRNSVGFDFHPLSNKLYFTDNGRDWLGDDLPSCELNRVDSEGDFFGFPYKHASNIIDPEFGDLQSGYDMVDPIAELGAHVAPTGMTFYSANMFPNFANNAFITLHGSWNRSTKVGYKVIRVIFDDNGNVETIKDFISGWLEDQKVHGRPAAPFIMSDGSILISDDKANVIYRVTPF